MDQRFVVFAAEERIRAAKRRGRLATVIDELEIHALGPLLQWSLDRRLDHDVAAVGAWNRTLDQQQAAFDVDANDFECLHRALDVAVLARHALAGKHSPGVLSHAERAGAVVRARITVRGAVRAEIVTLDHARKPAA